MKVFLMLVLTYLGFIAMYWVYGKFIARAVFKFVPTTVMPSKEFEDDIDYVPGNKRIVFGHHFTSIAGTGPIVGPAIAIIWGWVPALLWIFFGSIFIGAVHDFGVLFLSVKHKGESVSEIAGKYLNPLTRILFFIIVFLVLWIFIAILGLVIAVIFARFPTAVFPVWMEIPIAIFMGYMVYKKGRSLTLWSLVAIILMYLTIGLGILFPISFDSFLGIPQTGFWTIVLLIYAFIASILPVTTLLQPRDYINSHELFIAMALLIIGIAFSSFNPDFHFVAPATNLQPTGAPPIIPFLFITIACGAVSGFHALVSSGTTPKQVKEGKDTLMIGYGGMLLEGALAVLVIIAVSAGIGLGYVKGGTELFGIDAWDSHYSTWAAAQGLASKLEAFVTGSANMIASCGLPHRFGLAVIGVLVASFAGTSLDTATRIQRYIISELSTTIKFKPLKSRLNSTLAAVGSALILAFASGLDGKGALSLWPLFGAINQTLAAFALLLLTIYLLKKGSKYFYITGIPTIFMLIQTLWATIINQISFISTGNWLLTVVNLIIILIDLTVIFEGIRSYLLTVQKNKQ